MLNPLHNCVPIYMMVQLVNGSYLQLLLAEFTCVLSVEERDEPAILNSSPLVPVVKAIGDAFFVKRIMCHNSNYCIKLLVHLVSHYN